MTMVKLGFCWMNDVEKWVRRALLAEGDLSEAKQTIAHYRNLHLEADCDRMDARFGAGNWDFLGLG